LPTKVIIAGSLPSVKVFLTNLMSVSIPYLIGKAGLVCLAIKYF